MADQTYGQQFGENIGNAVQLLQQLLSGGTPVDAGMRAGKAGAEALGNIVGQGPSPIEAGAKAVLSPYQEGVKKAMKESGYAHATEAVQAGVPSTHIEQQAGLAPAQPGVNSNQLYTSSKSNNMMQNSQSDMGQFQSQNTPQAPMPTQNNPNAIDILGGLLKSGLAGAGNYVMAPTMETMARTNLTNQQAQNINPNGGIQAVGNAQAQVPLTAEQLATLGKSKAEMAYQVGKPMIEAAQAAQPLEAAYASWSKSKDVGSQQAYLAQAAAIMGTTPKELIDSLGLSAKAGQFLNGKLSPQIINGIHTQARNVIRSKTALASTYMDAINSNLNKDYSSQANSSGHPMIGQSFNGETITKVRKIK